MSVKNLPSHSLDQALGDLSHSQLKEIALVQAALDANAGVVHAERALEQARALRSQARAELLAFRSEQREAA